MTKKKEFTNLQCFCKRLIKSKERPDIKGAKCFCEQPTTKGQFEKFNVKNFIVVNKR